MLGAGMVWWSNFDGHRMVIARREIAAGEEVTYDYCVNGDGDTVWHCRCGAAR